MALWIWTIILTLLPCAQADEIVEMTGVRNIEKRSVQSGQICQKTESANGMEVSGEVKCLQVNYNGILCTGCSKCGGYSPWCATEQDAAGNYVRGKWEHCIENTCDPEAVLLVGGRGEALSWGGSALRSSEVLLPSGGSRRCNVPDLPVPITSGSLITKSTEIHFCGGSPNGKECHKFIDGAWTRQSQELATSRDDRMQVDMPGGSYIFDTVSSGTTYEFLASDSNNWVAGPTVPGRWMKKGCVVRISNEDFLIIGGYDDRSDDDDRSTRIVKFNTRSRTWEDNWGSLLQARAFHGCTYTLGKVIVAGGYNDFYGGYLSSTEIIDVDSKQSRSAGNMSEKRYGFALVTVNNKVLAIGGRRGTLDYLSSVEEFNLEEGTWSMAPYSMDEAREEFAYLVVPEDNICG